MIYAQIKSDRKLHLVCEAGEEDRGSVVRYGYLGAPLCDQPMEGNYRMTINLPMANACRKCVKARAHREFQ